MNEDLGRDVPSEFTYGERGFSHDPDGPLPGGYRHVRERIRIDGGHAAYLRLCQGIFTWEIQRRAGLTVQADAPRARVGAHIVLGFGYGPLRLPVPCEVVWIQEPLLNFEGDPVPGQRAGFGYGTLPGHPEAGEEGFFAHFGEDSTVEFGIVAYSRPGSLIYQLGDPVARACQRYATRRYLQAARSLAAGLP